MFKKNDVIDVYSLSPMQQGMLFHYLMDGSSQSYFEQVCYSVSGYIDLQHFQQGFQALLDRHDVLRTVFVYKKAVKPRQVVLRRREAVVHYEDISGRQHEDTSKYIENFKIKDRENGFDLSKDIPVRLSIIKKTATDSQIIWSFHHIIMDGWCSSILMKEMLFMYTALRKGETLEKQAFPPVPPYKEYIKWLEVQDLEKGLNYWRDYLENYETSTLIPRTPPLNKVTLGKKNSYRQAIHWFDVDAPLTQALAEVSGRSRVTLNITFQALWGILLEKYNNTGDVIFGSVVSGRPPHIEGIETMVGLFINTLPVRIQTGRGTTFESLLEDLQQRFVRSQPYQHVPLPDIQSVTSQKSELINHILVFENYPVAEEVVNFNKDNTLGFTVTSAEAFEQTSYDLDFVVSPGDRGDCLRIGWRYNAEVYDAPSIERMARHLLNIIRQAAQQPGIRVNQIDILSEAERNRLLYEFNDTDAEFPSEKTILQLFEEQVERNPNHVALVEAKDRDRSPTPVTYGELNRAANQLGCLLAEKGAGPDSIAAIMVERSIRMIIGIFGIWKAGGSYLPIDPASPTERIAFML
ncbi:MAG: AMP-binding protein, partial [bacterium]|nr:AMP-binding protein [bacterium]